MSAKPERVSSAARAVPPTCCGEPMKDDRLADSNDRGPGPGQLALRSMWPRRRAYRPHLVLIDRVNAKLASLKAERHDWCPH
jgi:hypothetical protein